MGWSGITSVATYSARNAQAISVQAGEMVRIRTIRPTTGPDGSVVIYDQTGAPIQTITVTRSNPDQTVEFATRATSLNYSTTVAFDAPGLQISWQGAEATPSYNPSTGATEFPGAVVAPWSSRRIPMGALTMGGYPGYNASSTTYTFLEKYFRRFPFTHVRIRWLNYGLAAVTITKAIVGTTATVAESDSVGTPVTPTVGGVAVDGLQIPAGTVNAITANTAAVPGVLSSDMIPVKSVARSDGGAGFGLSLRTMITAPFGYRTSSSTGSATPDQYGDDATFSTLTGDLVTTNQSRVCSSHDISSFAVVEFFCDGVQQLSVFHAGDSLAAGWTTGASGGICGPTRRAQKWNIKICPHVSGVGGSQSIHFQPRARAMFPIFKPQFAVIPAWSPNDGSTQANFDSAWAQFLLTVETAFANGVIPILHTPYPANYLGANLTRWQAYVTKLRTFAATTPGMRLVDCAALMEDPAAPGQWAEAYYSEATHGNNTAYDLIGQKIAEAVGNG